MMHYPKKLICLILFMNMLAGLVVSMADSVTYDVEQRTIQVSCSDCSTNGQYMFFFIRDGADASALSASDIYFMDQITADASGQITLLYVEPDFSSCQVLISGTFPSGLASPKVIGRFPAAGEFSMMKMPQGLIRIEEEAFENGTFTHVYLGSKVQSIGSKAFANCPNLMYIEIPAGTESIADNAFLNSPNVTIGCTDYSPAFQYAVRNGLPYRILEQ